MKLQQKCNIDLLKRRQGMKETKTIQVVIPVELYNKIKDAAEKDHRSLSNFLEVYLLENFGGK